jgi:hypothetical protein
VLLLSSSSQTRALTCLQYIDILLSCMQVLRTVLCIDHNWQTHWHISPQGGNRYNFSKSLLCLGHWPMDKFTNEVIVRAIWYGQKILELTEWKLGTWKKSFSNSAITVIMLNSLQCYHNKTSHNIVGAS